MQEKFLQLHLQSRASNIMTPQQQLAVLIEYLKLKLYQRDWHGVRDAAADIEVLEAKFPELKEK